MSMRSETSPDAVDNQSLPTACELMPCCTHSYLMPCAFTAWRITISARPPDPPDKTLQRSQLQLSTPSHQSQDKLPLKFSSSIHGNMWSGEAYIPVEYFPPKVSKFNAYAINGSETSRQYEALYPITTGQHQEPDFHRLEYFQKIDFQSIVKENWSADYTSSSWEM